MGLDMYLSKKLYIRNWDHMDEERKHTLHLERGDGTVIPTDNASAVEFRVAYWRKANAIHAWFVENVQNGQDDCREYYVDVENLEDLLQDCKAVMEVADISDGQPVHSGTTYYPGGEQEEHFTEGRAILNSEDVEDILPTQSGFFFGGTGYDEWYLQDIEYTIEVLTKILEQTKEDSENGHWFDFYYQSSW